MAHVLVAEDEAPVREFVGRALRLAGHRVTLAEDGLAALEALGRERFDLLLTDIVMPGLDGIALARKVSAEHPGLPVLMMSGYAAERQRAHNLDSLAHPVIAKPFALKSIVDAVEAALARPRRAAG